MRAMKTTIVEKIVERLRKEAVNVDDFDSHAAAFVIETELKQFRRVIHRLVYYSCDVTPPRVLSEAKRLLEDHPNPRTRAGK